jgi:hypothetical protein
MILAGPCCYERLLLFRADLVAVTTFAGVLVKKLLSQFFMET